MAKHFYCNMSLPVQWSYKDWFLGLRFHFSLGWTLICLQITYLLQPLLIECVQVQASLGCTITYSLVRHEYS